MPKIDGAKPTGKLRRMGSALKDVITKPAGILTAKVEAPPPPGIEHFGDMCGGALGHR
ncbi:MAG: hypothetical protein ACLR8Y_07980 [Alistipes indistinctus]